MAFINAFTGKEITASDYNLLQGQIETVMGVGSGSSGYGQTLTSSVVSIGNTIQAVHLNNLFSDMRKAHLHIFDTSPSLTDIVADNEGNYPIIDAGTKQTPIGWMDYDAVMSTIVNNRDVANDNQMESVVQTSLTSTKTGWNANIYHEISITFANENARRYFFNTGGQIWFYASITGATEQKSLDWNTMFTAVGTTKFTASTTTKTGSSGTVYDIGNYDLGVNYQDIMSKLGSGVYAANNYKIRAKREGTNKLWFRIEYNDEAGVNPNFDEANNGTLSSYIRVRRAVGSNVSVPAPTYNLESNL